MSAPDTICISVWSDYVCPFCYLEEPELERLKAEHGNMLNIEWRAFELRPDPVPTLDPDGEYLHTTWARAVYPLAAQRGMTLRLPPVQPRSRRALEAAEFARDQGRHDAMRHALFQGFFEHGQDLNDVRVLVAIGVSIDLDPGALRGALDQGTYTERVRRDESLAQELGITAVPTLLIRRCDQPLNAARTLSGAQPYEAANGVVESLLDPRPDG